MENKQICKYSLDGSDPPKAKKLNLEASLVEVRKELKLTEDFFFLTDGSQVEIDDESDFFLKDIVEKGTTLFHLKTKAAPPKPAPSLEPTKRFPPIPGAKLIDANRHGRKIYQYPHILIKPNPDKSHLKVIEVGKLCDAKYMILMGQTGGGKSTTINSMVNYLQGVRIDDDFRYELVVESERQAQSISQTTEPNIYIVESQIGLPPVVIIDTPGYGDTGGLEKDDKIDKMIRQLFEVEIDIVHLVCFVVKATMNRIGPTENYVYGKVLQMFGNDIGGHFQFLITFCDGGKPAAEDSLVAGPGKDQDGKPYDGSAVAGLIRELENKNLIWCSKFNNSGVFEGTSSDPFTKLYWDLYEKSMKSFFQKLCRMHAQSLNRTKEVIKERAKLEISIGKLNEIFLQQVCENNNIEKVISVVKTNFADLNGSKDYTVTVHEEAAEKKLIENGHFTTLCLECNRTCHVICVYGPNESKEGCAAMGSDGNCEACPRKCHHSRHSNVDHIIVVTYRPIQHTKADLKKTYDAADATLSEQENILVGALQARERLHEAGLKIQEEMRTVIERLGEIALRPNCFGTTGKYIEMLVANEEGSQGNLGKRKFLLDLLEKNRLADQAMESNPELKKKKRIEALEELIQQGAFRKSAQQLASLL